MPTIEEKLPVGRRLTLISICPRCGRLFPAEHGEVCPECGFPLTVQLDRRLAGLAPGSALGRARRRMDHPLERY
jgi:predicted amidophosphoribosyltransferase